MWRPTWDQRRNFHAVFVYVDGKIRMLHVLGEEGMDEMNTLHVNEDSQIYMQNMNFIKTEPNSDSEMYWKFSHNADELLDVKEENPVRITFPVMEIKTEDDLNFANVEPDGDGEKYEISSHPGNEHFDMKDKEGSLLVTVPNLMAENGIELIDVNTMKDEENIKEDDLMGEEGGGSVTDDKELCTSRNDVLCTSICYQFRQRTNSSEKCFKCGICGKMFAHKYILVAHQRIHTGKRCFVCEICGKSFIERRRLTRHRRRHSGEKPLECDACGKKFSDRFSLKRHVRIHTGEKLFLCEFCGKGFSDRSNFYVHQRLEGDEQPSCRTILNDSGTRMRYQRKHNGEKRFQCDACGKWFFDKRDVVKHLKIHTGEKPFICTICGKGFLERRKLLRHHRRINVCVAPLKCDICGKEFSSKGRILKHIKSH